MERTLHNKYNQRPQQAARPRRLDSWRLWAVLIFFVVFGLYNSSKLFSLQVLQHTDLAGRAEERIRWKDVLPPSRGLIYDARGQLLAGNTTAEDLYVDKTHSDDENLLAISNLLAPVLGQEVADLYNRLKNADSTNIRIASRLDHSTVTKLRKLVDEHPTDLLYKVRFESQPKRQYPGDRTAASVLGFTDYENQGHYGVEEYYNAQLAGKPGWMYAEHDAEGRPLVFQQPEMEAPEDGSDLVLTLDSAVQYLAERELKRSLDEFKADSGYIMVQDPNTGGILALANWPTFNPNDFNKIRDYSLFKNPAVNDVIEPGSTMKMLTYSAALDAGVITPDTQIISHGYLDRYNTRIWNATHTDYGVESMTEGLGRSDNIASMFAAEKLGRNKFYEYLKAFGIGKSTGVDMAGEVPGLIAFPGDKILSPINLYTNSFGQGVATTPMQLISAASAIANGGMLVKPHVMKEIVKDGETVQRGPEEPVRRVLKPESASKLADMLSYGVENGLVARHAAVPNYHVSVKTGTAQIAVDGGYGNGSFASAMGFAPSHGAQFTLYIGLLNPKSSQWGENTAAVSWGRLGKELLMYLKVRPDTVGTPTGTP